MTNTESGTYAGIDERIAANGSASIWVGDRAHLRGKEPGDIESELEYEDDTADQRSGWKVFPPRSSVSRKAGLEESATAKPEGDAVQFSLAIARRSDDRRVGVINVYGADLVNGTFNFGVIVHAAYKGQGYAGEAVLLAMRYMFDERRLQKCESVAYDYNSGSLALHRNLGFVEEGRRRRHAFVGGSFHDLVLFGMTVEEFHERYPKLRPQL